MTDQFADIRPYDDHEVRPVLDRLLSDDEFTLTLGRIRLPKNAARFPVIVRFLVRWILRRELRSVHDVRSLQAVVKRYMDRMVESSTDQFTVSGLDQLGEQQPWLFMSNHRDIALDPAFVNYAVSHNGHETVRIAIGDN